MTFFRRLVIGVAQLVLVVSIFVYSLICGLAGAALGSVYFVGLNSSSVQFVHSGSVTMGSVVGFVLGALVGITVTCSLTAIVFALAQIERNTRPQERDFVPEQTAQYRSAPRF